MVKCIRKFVSLSFKDGKLWTNREKRHKLGKKIKSAYTFDKTWLSLSLFWLGFQKSVKDGQ